MKSLICLIANNVDPDQPVGWSGSTLLVNSHEFYEMFHDLVDVRVTSNYICLHMLTCDDEVIISVFKEKHKGNLKTCCMLLSKGPVK